MNLRNLVIKDCSVPMVKLSDLAIQVPDTRGAGYMTCLIRYLAESGSAAYLKLYPGRRPSF